MYTPTMEDRKQFAKDAIKSKRAAVERLIKNYKEQPIGSVQREDAKRKMQIAQYEIEAMRRMYRIIFL